MTWLEERTGRQNFIEWKGKKQEQATGRMSGHTGVIYDGFWKTIEEENWVDCLETE